MADTVLSVDDDTSDRNMLYKVIRGAGMDAMTAVGGDQALETVRQHPVDLILMEINLQ